MDACINLVQFPNKVRYSVYLTKIDVLWTHILNFWHRLCILCSRKLIFQIVIDSIKMMELTSSNKGGGAINGTAALHQHHQFMYPTDLRVLGYAAGVVASSVLPLQHQTSSSSSSSPSSGQILSPLSPTNLSVGASNTNAIITSNNLPAGSSSGSPNSIGGFPLPRNLLFLQEVLIIITFFLFLF